MSIDDSLDAGWLLLTSPLAAPLLRSSSLPLCSLPSPPLSSLPAAASSERRGFVAVMHSIDRNHAVPIDRAGRLDWTAPLQSRFCSACMRSHALLTSAGRRTDMGGCLRRNQRIRHHRSITEGGQRCVASPDRLRCVPPLHRASGSIAAASLLPKVTARSHAHRNSLDRHGARRPRLPPLFPCLRLPPML